MIPGCPSKILNKHIYIHIEMIWWNITGDIELDFDLIPAVEKTEETLHERSKLTYAILLSYCGFGYHGLQM